MMPFILAFKNIISRRSSIFIVLFMTLAATLLSITNAIFDSSEHGIDEIYINSFTGDFIIRPTTTFQASLFGDETPMNGDVTELGHIVPYVEICELLNQTSSIEKHIPQLTGVARAESDEEHYIRFLFGVPGEDYISLMESISILEGTPYTSDERGVMLSKKYAENFKVKIGDIMQFATTDGATFRIRVAPVSAIYDYEIHNEIFDRFILIDPNTFRSIFDISDAAADGMEITHEQSSMLGSDLDWDSLFDDTSDVSIDDLFSEQVNSESIQEIESVTVEFGIETNQENHNTGTMWNFIICKLKNNQSASRTIRALNKTFKKNGWPVEAVNWKFAAGGSILFLYWLRIILNAGILVVLAAGFIVINNTLVINVLDRTKEIGTIRAIGGSKLFISLECMAETFILAIIAAILGNILGAVGAKLLTEAHIVLNNSFLRQLFGGETLVTVITWKNVRNIFVFMIFLGMFGWIYPVSTALKVSPLEAMTGGK